MILLMIIASMSLKTYDKLLRCFAVNRLRKIEFKNGETLGKPPVIAFIFLKRLSAVYINSELKSNKLGLDQREQNILKSYPWDVSHHLERCSSERCG